MTKPAFERDNILTAEERAVSARKCLSVLLDATARDMRGRDDWDFLVDQRKKARYTSYAPSERELLWLRDITERFL